MLFSSVDWNNLELSTAHQSTTPPNTKSECLFLTMIIIFWFDPSHRLVTLLNMSCFLPALRQKQRQTGTVLEWMISPGQHHRCQRFNLSWSVQGELICLITECRCRRLNHVTHYWPIYEEQRRGAVASGGSERRLSGQKGGQSNYPTLI